MTDTARITRLRDVRDDMRRDYERLAEEHREALYRGAMALTHNDADAEDLVQETLLRAYRFFHRFERGTNFKAWAMTILRNSFISGYRRKKRQPAIVQLETLELMSTGQSRKSVPESLLVNNGDRRLMLADSVDRALRRLSPEYRRVILLADLARMKYKEIADVLNIPAGTVMSRLFRARRLLRENFEESAA